MGRYIVKRLLTLIPVLFLVSILAFGLVRMMPGGAAVAYLRASNIPPTDEAIKAAEIQLGLDQPVVTQYVSWLKDAIRLDFGTSYYNNKEVSAELFGCLKYTIRLTVFSLLWLLVLALPLGIGAARKPGGAFDHFARIFSFLGSSTPSFLLGFVLVIIFSLKLGWLPVYGAQKAGSVILPSLTLAIAYVATYSRVLRNSLLENMERRYVLFGRARGLKENKIIGSHVLRNSLIPVITSLGVSFGGMLAGSVIVENVFSWPGMGNLIVSSINGRDFPMIQGYIVIMAVIFVLINLVTDIVCAWVNPQIRYEDAA